jgi:hypothetical protein
MSNKGLRAEIKKVVRANLRLSREISSLKSEIQAIQSALWELRAGQNALSHDVTLAVPEVPDIDCIPWSKFTIQCEKKTLIWPLLLLKDISAENALNNGAWLTDKFNPSMTGANDMQV